MNDKLSQVIEDLTAWRTCSIQIKGADNNASGNPRINLAGTVSGLVTAPAIPGGLNHDIACRFAGEPEYKAACEALSRAIDGLHAAREAIIERKARELASLVHGDQLSGIQKLVSEIQGAGA